MELGDLLYCRTDEDSYPLIANRIYQITKITDRVELDLNSNLTLSKSEVSEFFKSANSTLHDLSIKLHNKPVKEKIHVLISYIYFDIEIEKFLISKEFIDLFKDTNDYRFIIRVVFIVIDLLNKMSIEEIELFYDMEWDDVWVKIGEVMKATTDENK